VLIYQDSFDGYSVAASMSAAWPAPWTPTPAMSAQPDGWSTAGTSNGVGPVSSPNLCLANMATASSLYFLTCGDVDADSGQVTVSAYCNFYANPLVNPPRSGVVARGSSATLGAGTSEYVAWINWNTGGPGLSRFNSGTETQLATVVPTTGLISTWALVTLTLSGSSPTTCTMTVQDYLSGNYYSSIGVWQSSPTSCIAFSDSSPLTGAGYAGLFGTEGNTGTLAMFDNFTFGDARATPPPHPPTIVRVPFAFYPSNAF
jgi:hypothetical protein